MAERRPIVLINGDLQELPSGDTLPGAGGLLNNYAGTAAPTVTDDSGSGYAVGSQWVDVTNDNSYICADASVGAAVWLQTNGAGGGGGSTILNGAVDPTTEGADGDFYINTATTTIFGPKASGTWPAGVSLIGPAGADGNVDAYYATPLTTDLGTTLGNSTSLFASKGNRVIVNLPGRVTSITSTIEAGGVGGAYEAFVAKLSDLTNSATITAIEKKAFTASAETETITFDTPFNFVEGDILFFGLTKTDIAAAANPLVRFWSVAVDDLKSPYLSFSGNKSVRVTDNSLAVSDSITDTAGDWWAINLTIEPVNALVPAGGTAGQVLAKIDGTDYNTEWVDQTGGGGGGQVVESLVAKNQIAETGWNAAVSATAAATKGNRVRVSETVRISSVTFRANEATSETYEVVITEITGTTLGTVLGRTTATSVGGTDEDVTLTFASQIELVPGTDYTILITQQGGTGSTTLDSQAGDGPLIGVLASYDLGGYIVDNDIQGGETFVSFGSSYVGMRVDYDVVFDASFTLAPDAGASTKEFLGEYRGASLTGNITLGATNGRDLLVLQIGQENVGFDTLTIEGQAGELLNSRRWGSFDELRVWKFTGVTGGASVAFTATSNGTFYRQAILAWAVENISWNNIEYDWAEAINENFVGIQDGSIGDVFIAGACVNGTFDTLSTNMTEDSAAGDLEGSFDALGYSTLLADNRTITITVGESGANDRTFGVLLRLPSMSFVPYKKEEQTKLALLNPVIQESIATTYSTVNSDFNGNKLKKAAVLTAVTVEPGHTNTQPCTFVQTGLAQITFVAGTGVTIISPDNFLSTRTQGSMATLIQDSDTPNTYYLSGDLA